MEKILNALDLALHTPAELVLPEEKSVPEFEDTSLFAGHDETDDPNQSLATPDPAPSESKLPEYVVAHVGTTRTRKLDVYESHSKPHLVSALAKIIEIESPITAELATRRLAEAFGQQRITERFRKRFSSIQSAATNAGLICVRGDDFWRPGHESSNTDPLRIPGQSPESMRDIDDIPLIELENAAAYILHQQFSLPREELIRETLRLFSFMRATTRLSCSVNIAVDRLVESGRANNQSGLIVPKK